MSAFKQLLFLLLSCWIFLVECRAESEDIEDALNSIDGSPIRNASHRIIGGKNVLIGQFPSYATVTTSDHSGWYEKYCGAVLVAPNKLLTVAHCFNQSPRYVRAAFTLLHPDSWNGRVEVYRGIKACISPKFVLTEPVVNDFAVIILDRDANVQPIELPTEKAPEEATTVGVGMTGIREAKRVQMLWVRKTFCPAGHSHKSHICYTAKEGGGDTCLGKLRLLFLVMQQTHN